MPWKVKLLSYVTSRLRSSEQGLLVVAVDESSHHVAVVGSVPVNDGRFENVADAVTRLLPQGLLVAGSYTSSSGPAPWQPNNAAPLRVSATNTAETACWAVNRQTAQDVEAVASSSGDEDVALCFIPGFIPLRCHLDVQLCIQHSSSSSQASNSTYSPSAVQAAVEQLQRNLLTQQLACVSEALGQQQQPVLITSSAHASIQDLLSNHSSSSPPCISLLPLQHTGNNGNSSAPMFEYEPNKQQQDVTSLTLGLDVLCYAPGSMPASQVMQSLIAPAVKAQLATMQQQLIQQVADGQPLTPIRAHHFQPPGLGSIPVSICYPMLHPSAETTELKLVGVRQQLHQLLGLPDNVPMLRFSNALSWEAGAAGSESQGVPRAVRLKNVHEGLTSPAFGGRLFLIDGAYEYYHYMQDKFNDNGWGCAYRSLQTIISWFRLQKYTSKQIPSHRQIQEVLVSLGDKESAFIGSNNWIGAIELSYILDEYLGITSKVITVNKGSDIPNNARALAQHFATQGTPVMIGGGVLAYTLLGVAFNEDTGEAAFLILDPHYTGGEDLKKVQGGTWVAWKQLGDTAAAGGPLFVKDAFYNFLCPQRPRTV